MFDFLKKLRERFSKKGKEAILLLILCFGVFVACQGVLEEGNPFGPSTNTFRIIPSTTSVTTGANLTFKTIGGTSPYSWTSSNLNVGTIIVDTGVFTGGALPGTATITVVDGVGNSATATATIPGLPLTFDVAGATQPLAETATLITITANGSGAGFTTAIANDNTASTYETPPTIVTTENTITITSPAVLPTAAQGVQTYTITVTDVNNKNTGTISYVLPAAAAAE